MSLRSNDIMRFLVLGFRSDIRIELQAPVVIILCIRETPKQVLLQIVKIQMKYSTMLHFIRSTLFVKVKKIFRLKNTFFFKFNTTPLDMYDGLFQVYYIKPEGRIH